MVGRAQARPSPDFKSSTSRCCERGQEKEEPVIPHQIRIEYNARSSFLLKGVVEAPPFIDSRTVLVPMHSELAARPTHVQHIGLPSHGDD